MEEYSMKSESRMSSVPLLQMAALAFAFLLASPAFSDCAQWVNPFVGTSATGHTFPAACVPFGLVQAGPDTGNGSGEYCSGYRHDDRTICGFTQTHLNGTGCPDLGDVRILPMPFSTSYTALLIKTAIFSGVKGFNSNTVDLETRALLTSK